MGLTSKKRRSLLLRCYKNEHVASAITLARHTLRDKPRDTKALTVLGDFLPSVCRFEEGHRMIERLKEATSSPKGEVKVLELLGKSYVVQRKYACALEWYGLSYQTMKTAGFSSKAGFSIKARSDVLKAIIEGLSVLGRLDEARVYGEQLLELCDSRSSVFYLARVFRQAGRYPEALYVCQRTSTSLGNFEEDLEMAREFLGHPSCPGHTEARYHEATDSPDWCRAYAMEVTRRYCRLRPDDTLGQARLANTLAKLGRFKDARLAALEAAKSDSAKVRIHAWWLLTQICTNLGDFDAALAFGRRSIEEAPSDAASWVLAASPLVRQGRLEEALEYYMRGIQATKGAVDEAHLNAGFALRAMEKYEAALEHIHKSLEIDPEYKDTLHAKIDLEHALRLAVEL